MYMKKYRHSAIILEDKKIYLFGGKKSAQKDNNHVVECYDIGANAWKHFLVKYPIELADNLILRGAG